MRGGCLVLLRSWAGFGLFRHVGYDHERFFGIGLKSGKHGDEKTFVTTTTDRSGPAQDSPGRIGRWVPAGELPTTETRDLR